MVIVVVDVFVDLEVVEEDAAQAPQAMPLATTTTTTTTITTTVVIVPLYVITAASSSQAALAAENLREKQQR